MFKFIKLVGVSLPIFIYANETNLDKYQRSFNEKDYKSAKIYLLKEIESSLEKGETNKLEFLYRKIAVIYREKGEYYKAIGYFKLALKLELSSEKPSKIKLFKLYRNLSSCYRSIGNTFEAFKVTYKATKIASKIYEKNSKTLKELRRDIEKIQSNLIAASL